MNTHVTQFISDSLEPDYKHLIKSSELYDAYRQWCFKNKRRPLSQKTIKPVLESLGYFHTRRSGGMYYTGLAFKNDLT